jgi:DNA-binding transcriptional LysR family regulator
MHFRMDWKSVKFDWNRARAFLVTAEEGSLSAAARALGMAQPTLGRQVDALETELGVTLFERGGRGLTLTQAGLELLDHVRAMGDAAGRVSLTASGQAQSIEGSICITASEIYSAYLLPPIVTRLRREQPGIEVEIVASNAAIDLKRREADIAIRSFRPTQPDLIARKVGDDLARLYASQAISNGSAPRDAGGPVARRFHRLRHDRRDGGRAEPAGPALTQKNFPVLTASHLVHWELVKAGAASASCRKPSATTNRACGGCCRISSRWNFRSG